MLASTGYMVFTMNVGPIQGGVVFDNIVLLVVVIVFTTDAKMAQSDDPPS